MRGCKREREREGEGQTEGDHKENTDMHGERMLCKSIVTCVCLHGGSHVNTSCPLSTLPQTDEGNSAILTQILVRVLSLPSLPRPFLLAISKSGFHYNLST